MTADLSSHIFVEPGDVVRCYLFGKTSLCLIVKFEAERRVSVLWPNGQYQARVRYSDLNVIQVFRRHDRASQG